MASSSRFGCSDGLSLAGRMSDRREQSRLRRSRVVQVVCDGKAAHARCRDFSDTGMKLDLSSPLNLNDLVTVALSPTVALCASVAWINGRECGLVFDEPVDSGSLLNAAEFERSAEVAQALALLDGRLAAARSLMGRHEAPPSPPSHFQPGLAVTVMVSPDCEQRGVVRWARDNIAALELPSAATELLVEDRPTLSLPAPY